MPRLQGHMEPPPQPGREPQARCPGPDPPRRQTHKRPLSGAGFRSPAPQHKGLLLPHGRLCQAGTAVPGGCAELRASPLAGGTGDRDVPSEQGTLATCWPHLGIVQGQLILRALEDAFAARHREGSGSLGAREWRVTGDTATMSHGLPAIPPQDVSTAPPLLSAHPVPNPAAALREPQL